MINSVEKAIKHFIFKLSNVWDVTETDQQAIDVLIDFINKNHKKQFNENQLFGKLYIYLYTQLVNYYNCGVRDNTPQIDINKVLSTDINVLIESLTKTLNETETYLKLKKEGLLSKHPALLSEFDIEKESEICKELGGDILKEVITIKECEDNMISMINCSLDSFK